ncbi:MAG: L,D-transpeptidase family protein [Cyanobacteria bacterium P01_C01_bin.120]
MATVSKTVAGNFERTESEWMNAQEYCVGGLSTVMALWGALVAVPPAQAEAIAALPPPVRIELDYTPDRSPAPNHNAYALGRSADYLPVYTPQADRIVLRLGERRVYVYDNDQVLDSFPVAIGAPGTPTPTGEFEIFQMVEDPVWQSPWTGEIFEAGANSALGLRWIGFAEMSNGIIGFHGTPTVSSIGQAASNGCVRLRNEDVLALFSYVQIGMVVAVEP